MLWIFVRIESVINVILFNSQILGDKYSYYNEGPPE